MQRVVASSPPCERDQKIPRDYMNLEGQKKFLREQRGKKRSLVSDVQIHVCFLYAHVIDKIPITSWNLKQRKSHAREEILSHAREIFHKTKAFLR